ncbi:MAG: hypothetical protein A2817_00430 [Candidatus Yanofskybacteria bacterium RIFCSPHIGHO2_01_FULL_39_8b]|uniref:Ribosomal RNA small subunit methyltransferase E n=1 Tax=Candidatus Yanofskybacteria bacterium RIFCSPHIGHO2_01_FULL_39_8b TaxID=1802659 RepID=A0A1F8EEM3_9BACT|nr:MAG: hypothetical protein A2817_00430 [Candidatus Yanofskybacteria bacterium RIFCSPHIGHO2_01_FULL_39_8b]
MRLYRFIGDFQFKVGKLEIKDKELFSQLRNVLRLKAGEKIILCDGRMNEAVAEIMIYGKDFVEIEIKEIKTNQNEPERHVILYCSILKKENFELVVQKATEVGVKEIVPLITERTVKLNIRKDRLEKIIKEASEQSGRGVVPVLAEPVEYEKALAILKNNDLNLLFDRSGENFSNLERLDNQGLIGVWIGPEGGWTVQELKSVQRSNFKIINLGKLTLRAETAAIVATHGVIHKFICH